MWKLHIGVWQPCRITSRDLTVESYKADDSPLTSLDDCIELLYQRDRFFASIGYQVWFAVAIDPDGNRQKLR